MKRNIKKTVKRNVERSWVWRIMMLWGLLWVSLSARADWAPAAVQDSLRRMYPQAEDVAWTRDQGYYVAVFPDNGFDTRVWLDEEGRWAMTQTDWEVMDEAPDAVFMAFSSGEFSGWEVQNVTHVCFPRWTPMVAIEVGEPNLDTKYLLLYTDDGRLIRTRNVTDLYNILGASTFL